MSDQLNDIRLTIYWKNIANFDAIERIKFVHRFNNQEIKTQIIDRPNDNNDPGKVFFMISDDPVTLYSDIPRETQYVGEHEVSVYFSFVKDLDLWLDLLGNIYVVTITEDDLTRNFGEEGGGILILTPKLLDNSPLYSIDDNPIEYIVRLRKNDTPIFNKHIRLLAATIEGGFKMYHVNTTGDGRVVEWFTYDDTGSIVWVDNFDDAKTFYRVKAQALVPGTTERYDYDIMFLSSEIDIKSPNTRVLYKHPETQEVSFVQMRDLRTSFDDALILFTDAGSLTSQMIWGDKEIAYDTTQTTDYWGNTDCYRDCSRNPSCRGFKAHHRTVPKTCWWYYGGWAHWSGYRNYYSCDQHYQWCDFYLANSNNPQHTPQHKTSGVNGYRRYFYTGAAQ